MSVASSHGTTTAMRIVYSNLWLQTLVPPSMAGTSQVLSTTWTELSPTPAPQTKQLLASTLTTTTVMRTGAGDSTVLTSTVLVSVPEAGLAGRQGGMPTLQLDVDTIQQLASPHTITTTRRTGSGGSGVVTDMHSACKTSFQESESQKQKKK